MNLGEKIRTLRKMAGMTQEMLAEKLNVTRQVLSKWETGNSSPDIYMVKRLAEIFEITTDELLDMDVEKDEEDSALHFEDLVKLNESNRRKMVVYILSSILIAIGSVGITVILAMRHMVTEMEYILYRYIAVGEFAYAKSNDMLALVPCVALVVIGGGILLCYICKIKKDT